MNKQPKLKIRKGDAVKVISGKDKGKAGKILEVIAANRRVIVENINMHTKFEKAKRAGQAGQKISFAGSVDASNVMLIDSTSGQSTRVGYTFLENGTKQRIGRKSGKAT